MGNWVQSIGCFLTKNNADGSTLTKLVIEAITLLENAGYFVDAVSSDGAQWNRGMWKNFGVTEETGVAPHPCDETRDLHFFSDFPHLVKNMRKLVVDGKPFEVSV